MADYQKVVEMFGDSFASWLNLLKKWIDWGIDFKKLMNMLHHVRKEDLLGFAEGTHSIAKQKVKKFLSFVDIIKIKPVSKFRVVEFYQHTKLKEDRTVLICIGDTFLSFVLSKCEDLELSLNENVELAKFKIDEKVFKYTNIESDFNESPIIPIKIFLPLLKDLLESQPRGEKKEGGLDVHKQNIFHVDLTEIDNELGVVPFKVFYGGLGWYLEINSFHYFYRDGCDGYFFSFVNSLWR